MDALETPRLRPTRRGGKYHPGQTPTTPFVRETTPDSVIHHPIEHLSGTESEATEDGEDEDQDQNEDDEELEDALSVASSEAAEGDYEDLDRTIAINLDRPISQQLDGLPFSVSRSKRHARRLSPGGPGCTPAKRRPGAFDWPMDDDTTNFTNTNLPPSALTDEMQNFPYLTQTSPQKMNALYGMLETPGIRDLSSQLIEKDAKIRQLEEMLHGGEGQSFDEFVNYSPEKKISPTPNDPQLTARKRRSPTKFPPSLNATPTQRFGSKSFKSPPVKAFAAMFENAHLNGTPIRKPKVTKEEVKEAKRRRETMEFRQFSAIDLNELKSYLPQNVATKIAEELEDTPVPDAEDTTQQDEAEQHQDEGAQDEVKQTEIVESKPEIEVDMKLEKQEENEPITESEKILVEDNEEEAKSETQPQESDATEEGHALAQSTNTKVPTPVPTVAIPLTSFRRGHKRSDSAPATPRAPSPDPQHTLLAAKDTSLAKKDSEIAMLRERISELEDSLATSTIQLEKTGAALVGERRARIAAEETCAFLEAEKKFGVCCAWAPGAGKTETEAAATLPLPSSPASSVVSHKTFDERPSSRMGPRPTRPASRLRKPVQQNENAYTNVANAANTRKRPRDDSHTVVGRKPQVARPDKRVLSAGMAAGNAILGNNSTRENHGSALAKKPEKPAVRTASRTTRDASGTAATRALARGARR